MDLPFDVVSLPETDHVAVGDRAPEFTRPLASEEYWTDTALSAAVGDGPAVLLFHPMVGSFPGTYLYRELADRDWDERATVLGCAISTPYQHVSLLSETDVAARIYSDPGNEVAEAYGVAHDLDGMAGVSEPRPAAFVLDGDRTVTYAWVAEEWPAFPPYDDVEAALPER